MQLKTTKIHGKDYVEVKDRLKYFRAKFPDFCLVSEIVSNTEKDVIIRASVINPQGVTVATGTAHEVAGSSNINRGSHIENCETSAWGRALGNFGIGIDGAVASADEVINRERIDNERELISQEQSDHIRSLYGGNEKVLDAINKKYGGINMMPLVKYNAFMDWAASCTK